MSKIIILTSRFPFPLTKGDRLRVFFQLQSLAKNHDIYLMAINDKKVSKFEMDQVLPYCKSIQVFVLPLYKRLFQVLISLFKSIPLQVAFFYNRSIRLQIEKSVLQIKPNAIHCHLIRTTEYVKSIAHDNITLDFMDAFGRGMEKRELIEKNIFKRALLKYEKNQLFLYESKVFDFVHRFCIISKQDQQFIQHSRANEIAIIPNGVDFNQFYPRNAIKKYDLVFMGNIGYPPNVEAILFVAKEIIPLLRIHKPNIRFLIAGISAAPVVKRLQSQNIDVIEHFEDISDALAMSKMMIAPMKLSIGLQNKIIQAMAMKIPCVVSTLSNNAIKAPNRVAIIEANSPKEYCEEILDLLQNEEKANSIGEQGFDFVKRNFSWETQNVLLEKMIFKQ